MKCKLPFIFFGAILRWCNMFWGLAVRQRQQDNCPNPARKAKSPFTCRTAATAEGARCVDAGHTGVAGAGKLSCTALVYISVARGVGRVATLCPAIVANTTVLGLQISQISRASIPLGGLQISQISRASIPVSGLQISQISRTSIPVLGL